MMPAMRKSFVGRVLLLILVLATAFAPPARALGDATRPAGPASPASRPVPLAAGDYRRGLTVGGLDRSYLVHVPPAYDPKKPTPVVLAFHGAMMNAAAMVQFSGLNKKADEAGFVVVYPNGVGLGEAVLFFNVTAKSIPGGPPDDVAFTSAVLDDLATVLNVDAKRVYATGMSNGGMMCHRLAAELSDRIAAVAPVAGTLALAEVRPGRPVSVMHFHGTADHVVPWNGPKRLLPPTIRYVGVDDTIKKWVEADGCPPDPKVVAIPDTAGDGTTAKRITYGPGKNGAEVVLVEIEGTGHTWPGMPPPVTFLGKSTKNVSANDMMWEFFRKHPMK